MREDSRSRLIICININTPSLLVLDSLRNINEKLLQLGSVLAENSEESVDPIQIL